MDITNLRKWLGRTEIHSDQITRAPVAALSATLDRDDAPPRFGDNLPPLWHWLYFLPIHRQSEIDLDGHKQRGNFLPPVPLPRRMWAGGRFRFYRPLEIGAEVTRISKIADISSKDGRTGPLAFVLVRHEIADAAGVALTEEHDIVYRDNSKPDDPVPEPHLAPTDHSWCREIRPDDVLLFRYSALTFNGHRIHYDRRYVTEVEGYPGLIVHGPLIATLLLDLLRRSLPDANITEFSFRAVKPIFDIAPFSICGLITEGSNVVKLWAKDVDGWLAMDATATIGPEG